MNDYVDLSDALYGYPLDNVYVIDTETTGLEPGIDEILSIAIVDGHGEPVFFSYVKPTYHDSWEDAEKINHISWDMVKDSPEIAEIVPRISEILGGEGKLVAGYNVKFDLKMLYYSGSMETSDYLHTIDVMELYRDIKPVASKGRLVDCAEHYGLSFDAHSSLADAMATAYCFRHINKDDRYLEHLLSTRCPKERQLTFSQTKMTRRNISDRLGPIKSATYAGSIRLGEITQGKNKGVSRIECFVEDSRVGVGSHAQVASVREALALKEDDDFPDRIDANVQIERNGESYSCAARIEVKSELRETISRLCKDVDPQDGIEAFKEAYRVASERFTSHRDSDATNEKEPAITSTSTDIADSGMADTDEGINPNKAGNAKEGFGLLSVAVVAIGLLAFALGFIVSLFSKDLSTAPYFVVAICIYALPVAIVIDVIRWLLRRKKADKR